MVDEIAKEYIEALKTLPLELKVAQEGLLEIQKNREATERVFALLKIETAMVVSQAKDAETGKAVYGNETARDAETGMRLSRDEKAVRLKEALDALRASGEKAKIELAYLENRYSSARHILDYLAACKGAP